MHLPLPAPRQPLFVYYHTHWDREWYLPFREYQHRLLKVVDGILNALEQDELQCFTLDGQTVLLEDYLAFRPENETRIKALVQAERLSIGPWYVMPDEFLVSGESLIRNLQRGLAISKSFGENTFTGYLPDTFGHSADIPMVLRQFGIESAIVWRGIQPQQPWFQWQSPTGDTVLGYHLTEGYFQNVFHMGQTPDEPVEFMATWLHKVSALTPDDAPMLFPVGADHLGYPPGAARRVAEIAPFATPITADQFMRDAPANLPDNLTVYPGELRDHQGAYLLPGVYSSRMYLKQWNRRLEWRLTRQLEPLLSSLTLLGKAPVYTRELDCLWQTLLLNHPHDSICGCSVDSVHRENEQRFEQIEQLSGAMVRDAHHLLAQHFQPAGQWLLLNLSPCAYTGVVEITQDYPLGQELPPADKMAQVLAETTLLDESYLLNTSVLPLSENKALRRKSVVWADSIPGMGLWAASSLAPASDTVEVTPKSLENAHIKLTLKPDDTLEVLEKATGKTHSGLHRLVCRSEQGDSYNAASVPGSFPEQAELVVSEIIHSGPLRGTLRLQATFKTIAMSLETDVTLDAGSPRLVFETRFINETPDQKIQVCFDTGLPITEVVAEGHFAPVTRPYDPDYRIEQAMPAPRLKELGVNSGPIQRFIGVNDQTLLTEGLTEYEVEGNHFKLTLLRAFGMLSRDDTGVRGSHAGPPLPTGEGQCLHRPFAGRYAWLPGFTLETAFAEADRFYGALYGFDRQSLTSAPLAEKRHAFIGWDNPAVVLSAWVPGPDALRLRLLNPTDRPQRVQLSLPESARSVTQETLGGEALAPVENGALLLSPYELQTLAIQLQ